MGNLIYTFHKDSRAGNEYYQENLLPKLENILIQKYTPLLNKSNHHLFLENNLYVFDFVEGIDGNIAISLDSVSKIIEDTSIESLLKFSNEFSSNLFEFIESKTQRIFYDNSKKDFTLKTQCKLADKTINFIIFTNFKSLLKNLLNRSFHGLYYFTACICFGKQKILNYSLNLQDWKNKKSHIRLLNENFINQLKICSKIAKDNNLKLYLSEEQFQSVKDNIYKNYSVDKLQVVNKTLCNPPIELIYKASFKNILFIKFNDFIDEHKIKVKN